MPASQSKPPSASWSLPWALALGLAALALAGSLLVVWRQEDRRPWQEEVAAINQARGRLLAARLRAMGAGEEQAREQAGLLATQPAQVKEVIPAATGRPERCLTCHQGIEEISPSHPVEAVGCVVCHGGQGLGLTKTQAHQGLRGRNPSALDQARVSCGGGPDLAGRCHAGRSEPHANMVDRVERTIMATMTGVITSLGVAWGSQTDWRARWATAAVADPNQPQPAPAGTVASLLALPGDPPAGDSMAELAGDHWRKFCARCHLRAARPAGASVHGLGCAACHGARNASGFYQGQDAALPRDQPGHAARHTLQALPPEENCRRCHNRSSRIGLNYRGWMEDENGAVPWHQGSPQPALSGGRGVRSLLPDVHAAGGMTCTDCHSPREIMGDGRLYGRMRFQTEMRCATCHGGPGAPVTLGPPDPEARFETVRGPLAGAPPLNDQTRLALSSKARPLAGLRQGEKGLRLFLRSAPGKSLACKSISQDPAHNLPGHRRLTCQACHSRWTPQCYGCHDYRLQGGKLWDYAAQKPTPGAWSETRDLYRFSEPILGVDSQGRIRPLAPGCQVVLSQVDGQGRPQVARQIARSGVLSGNGVVVTPVAPHTTRREVRPCEDCHANPRALGLGPGPRPLGRLTAQPLGDLSLIKWPADWETLVDQAGRPLQGSTHQGARPLNPDELGRVLGFAPCLPCHRQPQDPVLRDPARARARVAPGGDLFDKHQQQVAKALK